MTAGGLKSSGALGILGMLSFFGRKAAEDIRGSETCDVA